MIATSISLIFLVFDWFVLEGCFLVSISLHLQLIFAFEHLLREAKLVES